LLAPGDTARLRARIVNDGNVAEDATLVALTSESVVSSVVNVTFPVTLAAGDSYLADVLVKASAPGSLALAAGRDARAVVTVAIAERDVAIVDARVDAGGILNVTVENRGALPVPGVHVRATSVTEDARELANATLGGLAPRSQASYVLLLPPASGDARVEVLGSDGLSDATPSDNERVLSLGRDPQRTASAGVGSFVRQVPDATIPLLFFGASLAAVALLRRRRA
jgi:hypothetical protein